jgi:hypothetical protein
MNPSKTTARTAGLLCLVVAVSGGFSMLYVPSLIGPGDVAATAIASISHASAVPQLHSDRVAHCRGFKIRGTGDDFLASDQGCKEPAGSTRAENVVIERAVRAAT